MTRRDDNKLYIISCRDPLSQYLSLYSHGNAGKGALRSRLNLADMSHFYDGTKEGFTAWLELLLDPVASQKYLIGRYNHRILDFVGLQTLRFLRLAFASPLEVFATMHSRADVQERLKTEALYKVVLKAETLTDDLRKLITGEFSNIIRRPIAAKARLAEDRRRNSSTKPNIDLKALPLDIVSRVQEREWVYFDELGYAPYIS